MSLEVTTTNIWIVKIGASLFRVLKGAKLIVELIDKERQLAFVRFSDKEAKWTSFYILENKTNFVSMFLYDSVSDIGSGERSDTNNRHR